MTEEKTHQITVRVSDKTYQRLKKYADRYGESISDIIRSGIGYIVITEEEQQETISLHELSEYEMGMATRDVLKKYCSNCAEEIEYPKPGRRGTIWKSIEISVNKEYSEFVSAGEFYLCDDCVEVKEKRLTNKKISKDEGFKKYCRNCGERISYPTPGKFKTICCQVTLAADRKGSSYIKIGEAYFCDKCARVKEENHVESPMDNLVYDVSEEWEKIVNDDSWDRLRKKHE